MLEIRQMGDHMVPCADKWPGATAATAVPRRLPLPTYRNDRV
jgi:hypothetical protein